MDTGKTAKITAISATTNALDMQYFLELMLQDRYGVNTLLDLSEEQLDEVENITRSWQNLAAASLAASQVDMAGTEKKNKKKKR